METIKITMSGKVKEIPKGTTLLEFLQAYPTTDRPPVVAARVGNRLRELTYVLTEDATVTPVDLSSQDGMRIYSRSLKMVLIRAVREIFPTARVKIHYSLCKGLYGEIQLGRSLTERDLKVISARMREIIEADDPIEKRSLPVEEAIKIGRAHV